MTLLYILIAVIAVLLAAVAVVVRRVNRDTPETAPAEIADDCCGAHAVCERDTLLSNTDKIIYFDDEELDALRGVPAGELSEEQVGMIEEVFYSLREQDVSGWIRSLQLRNIELPDDLREQAILIVSERRQHTLDTWNATHKD